MRACGVYINRELKLKLTAPVCPTASCAGFAFVIDEESKRAASPTQPPDFMQPETLASYSERTFAFGYPLFVNSTEDGVISRQFNGNYTFVPVLYKISL